MLRFLAVFLALFLGAIAGISLLPNPPKVVAPAAAVPAQPVDVPAPTGHQEVRVVYPAPAVPPTPAAAAASAPSSAPRTEAATAMPAPVVALASRDPVPPVGLPVPATPADASAQAGTTNVNLNTASIEALNNIPGVGRIGRTIASHRPYRSVEDLLQKRVIRKSVYDRIKDQVAAQ